MNRLKVKTKHLVLVIKAVDDYWQSLSLLNTNQYQILECASRLAALEICTHQIPDCILLDRELASLELNKHLTKQLPTQVPLVIIGSKNVVIENLDYLIKETLTTELLTYAIGNAIAQARLKQKLELGIGINILTQTIHSTHDLSTIFTAATTTISKLLDLKYVEVSQYLSASKIWTPFSNDSDVSSHLLSNELISFRLLQGEILSINSTAAVASNINCIEDDEYEGSWLLVPLVINSGVWGAISINGRVGNRYYWQDQEIDLVSNTANQLGIAIQQSLSYAQIEAELADRRRIEIDLRQSQQLYASLAEASPVGIFRTDSEGNCLYVNERWCQIAGLSANEAMGLGWIKGIYEGDRQLVATEWQKATTAKRPFSLEYRFQPQTELMWVYGQAVAELGINGNILGYVGTITDISDRKLGELLLQELNDSLEIKINERTQALIESETKFRSLIEGGGELVWSGNLNGELTYLSPQFKTLFGWEPEMYLGKQFMNLIHPENISEVKAYFSKLIESNQKKLAGIEFRHLCQDGSYIWVRSNPTLILNAEGKVVAVQGILQDISDRKQVEEQLLASQKELEQFFAMDLNLLCIADSEGHFLQLNQAWEGTLGYPLSELEGQLFLEFVHPDDILNTLEAIAKLENQELVARFVNRYRCKDGSYRYIEWHSRTFDDKIYASAHDITAQKEIIDRLYISEQNLREAQRVAHVGSWEYNLITQKILWSLELFNIYGLDPNQTEPSFPEYLQLIHPEDRAEMERKVEQAIKYGTAYEIEHRIVTENGIRWILGRGEVEQNAQGKAIRIFGTASDTTMLKEAAIALSQSKEAAEAGTKAKSEFLASMSHEIRTPMNGVLGMAELLAGTDLNPDQQEFVQTIRESGDALLTIINDILDFSKIEAGMLELEERVFMLADIVKSVSHLLGKAASDKGIVLTSIIDPHTPTTFLGDSSRIRQILLNLVGNAIKFTKTGNVRITINSQLVNEVVNTHQNNEYELLVAVKDSGIGIRSDRLSKLFQPFTQADAAISRKYGGTGLGLAISKRLVELMGGTIWVESSGSIGGNPPTPCSKSITQGSTFYFTLKIIADPTFDSLKSAHFDQKEHSLPTSPLKILLAEDNAVNQKVMIRILQRLGYGADIASNGLKVLEALTKQKYDLIFMDMQMPEMDGIEATQRIYQLYPITIRPHIIAMTANAMPSDRQACLAAGMNDYISKPVRIEELLSVLKNVEIISLGRE